MNLFEKQHHIQNLKDARDSFYKNRLIYEDVQNALEEIIAKLEKNIENELSFIKTRSEKFTEKLESQNLDSRKNFVNLNRFNEFDLQCLSGLLLNEITNNIPVLELFPGTGQFLPYAVSAEPLYIADKFIEICNEASAALNNNFYSERRLRKYQIDNNDTSKLPQNSFGIVYCFNEFFMANENYILKIAKQVHNLLYSGGKFIFNFLPYDQLWSQQMVYNSDFTAVNYKDLINELTIMGYTILNYEIRQLKSSYIIAQKNGELQPRYKIGGGVAEIIDT